GRKGDKAMGRKGDKAMGRKGDKEMGRTVKDNPIIIVMASILCRLLQLTDTSEIIPFERTDMNEFLAFCYL
ncbi:MAG: hypothetical protein Q7J86_02570, partial [Bacteroidota bacterium]|nr:hypothetical protein [Bacteroidota bacterium]